MTYLSTADRTSQDWQDSLDHSVVIAIKKKQPTIMKLLVKAGANLDQKNNRIPLLFEAFRSADPDILGTFLENFKADIASQLQGPCEMYNYKSFLKVVIETQRLDFIKRAFSLLQENNIIFDKTLPLHCATKLTPYNRQSANADYHDRYTDVTGNKCAILEYLLEQGFDVNCTRTPSGTTPLHEAAQAGNMEAVQCLIKHGADVMARDKVWSRTPLHMVVNKGNLEVAQCLTKHGADVMARDKDGQTPLHCAVEAGNIKVVQCLIKHGADVMAMNMEGTYPWMIACQRQNIYIMAEVLNGVDLKQKLPDGKSFLHQSCLSGWVDGTKYLLEHGADVNCIDDNNLSPLFVLMLFNQHTDQRKIDSYSNRNRDVDRQLMQILVDYGADVNHRDSKGHTMLMKREISAQKYSRREFLIQHGADLNAIGPDLITVLWTAIEIDCHVKFNLTKDLLARNVDIGLSRYKYKGMTPLQLAYRTGHSELCDILLDARCSLHGMLEFMNANVNLEMDGNMQRVRCRIVELISKPYSLQELSRQAVLRAMGHGNLVAKVYNMKEREILPINLLNFLLRNLDVAITSNQNTTLPQHVCVQINS